MGLKWIPVTRGVRFLVMILLGRFIVPAEFAVVDASMVILVVLQTFRQSGFGQAFIQRQAKDPDDEQLAGDTTFVFTAFLNGLIFAASFAVAPWLASFFQDNPKFATDDLTTVLRIMLCLFLVDGLALTPTLVLQKRLDFGWTALAEVIGTLVFAVLAIGLILLGYGVWSVVWAQVSSQTIQMLLKFRYSGWWPKWQFSWPHLAEMFVFGKWMWGFAALSAVGGIFDRMLLGTLRSMVDLGLYGRAFNVCNMPSKQIAFVVNAIAFPALAQRQSDTDALRRGYRKALSHVAILALPMGCGLVAVSEEFIATVFRAEYGPAAGIIEVLAFYGMALSTSSVAGPVLQAIGKPKILLYSSIVHHALLFPLVWYLGRQFGPVGVAYGVLIPMLVSTVITYGIVVKYLHLGVWDAIEPVVRPAIAAVVMIGVVLLFKSSFRPWALAHDHEIPITKETSLSLAAVQILFASTGVGIVAYSCLVWIVNRSHTRDFLRTVREVIRTKRVKKS
ncbi:MAG: lipopolysaccharide biosynthesis protein [Planctomycetes bacterium]|nr:lipopolysaccharide biosynthesis protein [Planctomycetota bacterium]